MKEKESVRKRFRLLIRGEKTRSRRRLGSLDLEKKPPPGRKSSRATKLKTGANSPLKGRT